MVPRPRRGLRARAPAPRRPADDRRRAVGGRAARRDGGRQHRPDAARRLRPLAPRRRAAPVRVDRREPVLACSSTTAPPVGPCPVDDPPRRACHAGASTCRSGRGRTTRCFPTPGTTSTGTSCRCGSSSASSARSSPTTTASRSYPVAIFETTIENRRRRPGHGRPDVQLAERAGPRRRVSTSAAANATRPSDATGSPASSSGTVRRPRRHGAGRHVRHPRRRGARRGAFRDADRSTPRTGPACGPTSRRTVGSGRSTAQQ